VNTFEGKTAMVTGAASGIGRASAASFARLGANVLVCDIDQAGGEETVALIRGHGGSAAFQSLDVRREEDVKRAVTRAVDHFGGLHMAHNNAGIAVEPAHVNETSSETWRRVIDINLTGVFLCMKYQIDHMLTDGGGAIVNTSSLSGLGGSPLSAAYTASKHGVVGLTKTAGFDLASRGIRVNAVCPGATLTPMMDKWIGGDPDKQAAMDRLQPMRRMASPQEVAEVVTWLCSDSASYVTGVALPVDGGLAALAGGGNGADES
jgi:NAD(P)-dependent dehydrogenase (short-subunit alcohol dehydrogenase family)